MMPVSVNFLTSVSAGWVASLAAAFAWSFSVSIYRTWGSGRSPRWLNLFKGSVALVFFGLTALCTNSNGRIPLSVVAILAWSGFLGILIGDWAFFAALMRIGGTLTAAIQCLAPPMTAVLAWVFLAESLESRQVAGLVVTSLCLGALVFLESRKTSRLDGSHPSVHGKAPYFFSGVSLAVIAAISQAAGAVVARPVLKELSPFVAASLRLWFPVSILIVWEILKRGGIVKAFRGFTDGDGIVMLALAGFLGTFLGLTLMMYGMAHAPLGIALALNSTYPIWILLWEWASGKSTVGVPGGLLVLGSISGIWLMI